MVRQAFFVKAYTCIMLYSVHHTGSNLTKCLSCFSFLHHTNLVASKIKKTVINYTEVLMVSSLCLKLIRSLIIVSIL